MIVDATEQRVKHLELLQVVITRLGQNSFTVRGWSVTLVSIIFALIASKDAPPRAIVITMVPTLVFWGLDAYYLRRERLFRKLFMAVARDLANGTSDVKLFVMDPSAYSALVPGWCRTLASRTVLPIPAVLTVIAVGYGLFVMAFK